MKMTFTNEQLQTVLNYDSHGTPTFTDLERMAIHRAISYRLSYGSSLDLPVKLSAKVKTALKAMKEENYEPWEVRYIEDSTGIKQVKYN